MRRIKFYDDHELAILWQGLDRYMYDPEWRVWVFCFRLMLCTGSRMWETTRIRLQDCGEHYIHIEFGKGEGTRLGEFKERDAEWFDFFEPYYQEYLASLPRGQELLFPILRRRLAKDPEERKLYPTQTIDVSGIRKRWVQFTEMIQLRYLPPHEAFRKTFATWGAEILQRGDLQDQLGHQSYKTTDKIYRGSIPGRRFRKPPPQWQIIAARGAEVVRRRLERRHLRVVG